MVPLLVDRPRMRGPVAGTFWGKAWCDRIEAAGDYMDRLPLGRSRLRAGAIYDLTIAPREVFAYVAGEELHEVLVRIAPFDEERCESLARSCTGRIGSVVDLLSGNLGADALEVLIAPGLGLIPEPSEIRFQCDCADYAGLCVHGAAMLYAIGLKLDMDPSLLFVLREVDQQQLVTQVTGAIGQMALEAEPGSALPSEDLASIFGIEVDEESI